jgi:hypothetical protein
MLLSLWKMWLLLLLLQLLLLQLLLLKELLLLHLLQPLGQPRSWICSEVYSFRHRQPRYVSCFLLVRICLVLATLLIDRRLGFLPRAWVNPG